MAKSMSTVLYAGIADALGWQTEFLKTRQDVEKAFGSSFVEGFKPWTKRIGGRFHGYLDRIQAGDYSDDTQMTLMTARSLREDGSFSPEYFASVELPTFLLYARGAGSTVKEAARKISRKSVRWNTNFYTYKVRGEPSQYRDAGANGAAMRIAPHALANLNSPEKGEVGVWQNAIITHGHPRAIAGAVLYYHALLLASQSLAADQYLHNLKSCIAGLRIPKDSHYIAEWLWLWNKNGRLFQGEWQTTIGEIERLISKLITALSQDGDQAFLKGIGAYDPFSKGSGTVSITAGVYFYLKYRQTPEKGLKRCVNMLGTDTDTVAAVAGGLFGIDTQCPSLPQEWLAVQDADYLNKVDASDGTLLRLPQTSSKERDIPIADWHTGDEVSYSLFGEGKILQDWQETTLTKKFVHCVRVRWNYGQTMVLSTTKGARE
jgi:ADP-ribosylglycohydrolase